MNNSIFAFEVTLSVLADFGRGLGNEHIGRWLAATCLVGIMLVEGGAASAANLSAKGADCDLSFGFNGAGTLTVNGGCHEIIRKTTVIDGQPGSDMSSDTTFGLLHSRESGYRVLDPLPRSRFEMRL